jgi:hypothetical protein
LANQMIVTNWLRYEITGKDFFIDSSPGSDLGRQSLDCDALWLVLSPKSEASVS